MHADEKRALLERYLDAYNSFDIERMMELIHQDIEFKNVSGGEVNASASGKNEFRALAEQSKRLFSSRKQTVTKFNLDGDGASLEIEYVGVLATNLPNGMKLGETLQLTGRSELDFRDGKIYRLTDYS
ncbi:MAG: nuclear transport factor 2 family protein [Leptolyngbyaceae cyanobacterium RM2_2_4]|nr:nuclear transport factor 2 family protein [Leptolyngbyaceae cyanobacterium SM1_4_3]NJN91334.1 nuclear transport factor 2 family protein [Leptolyngbyaceae cyanobacterium SL_5_14]NJO51637.1 nuclear transport factor 2 family protein [Leptolyngbyaceae cyanobacterium RM2_2_4]